MNALAKSYLAAQSTIGTSVRIPGPDAGAEDWAKFDAKLSSVPGLVRLPADGDAEGWSRFHQRLGMPEAPTGYRFDPVEGIPEEQGGQLDAWLAQVAHGARLTQSQAAALRSEWMGQIAQANAQDAASTEAAASALRTKWGSNYEERRQIALKAVEQFAGKNAERMIAELDRLPPDAVPAFIEFAHNVGMQLGEDIAVRGGSDLLPTLDEIEAQIAEIRGNRAHPFHDPRSPGYANAFKRMEWLYSRQALLRAQGS